MGLQKVHEVSLIGLEAIIFAIEGLVKVKEQLLLEEIFHVEIFDARFSVEIDDCKLLLKTGIDDPDQIGEKAWAVVDDDLLKGIQNSEQIRLLKPI